jgi:hypothetical protein
MQVFDYLHDDDDLRIANGDFVKGESTLQHQSLLTRFNKGELRQFPKTGVGIDNFLLDDEAGDVFPEIQKQFEADGMVIRDIDIEIDNVNGKLKPKVNAFYP